MIGSTAAPKPSSSVRFESVFREGMEKNWEKFQKLFSETFSEEYKQSLLERNQKYKDLCFRLIREGDNPIGIVVYVSKPSTSYKIFGYEYALFVKALHVVPQFNRAVRQVLIQTAIDMQVSSIIVNVLESDEQLKKALVERSFKKIAAAWADKWEFFVYDGKKELEQQQDDATQEAGKRVRGDDPAYEATADSSVKVPRVEKEIP